jgi:hypothetical protein
MSRADLVGLSVSLRVMKPSGVIPKTISITACFVLLLIPLLVAGCKSVCCQEVIARKPAIKITEVVVAQDGSGKFTNVQDAIMSVPMGFATNPVVIRIKPGTYKEQIYIQREKRFFHLVGEDATNTILTFDLNANIVGPAGKPIRWGRRWRSGLMQTVWCSATVASSAGRIRFWRIAGGITLRIVTLRGMWISSSAGRRVFSSGARSIA